MMIAKKKAKQTQKQRFIEAARELGADEDEEAFKRKLERIAKAKPETKSK